MAPQNSDNILVIKLGALGDFVQALGPMAAIRRHHPQARLALLTTAPFEIFGQACGYFDDVMIDARPRWHDLRGWMDLRARLSEGKFSRVYDLQNNDRTSFYFRLMAPRPEWVGVARGASHRNASPQRTAGIAFDGHVQTLSLAGICDVTSDNLSWVEGDIRKFHLPQRYALLVPGAAPQHPEKRWPALHYAELASLLDRQGIHPVIIGAAADDKVAQEICAAWPRAMNLTGRTTLFEVALLARSAAAAIGNDTGPMHMIAATGCPATVLFSRHSNPARHAPQGAGAIVAPGGDLSRLPAAEVFRSINFRAYAPFSQKIP